MASTRFVTLQDIADRAGVSRSAVSLALRKSPRISAELTERIAILAERMKYKTNPLLRVHMAQLRSNKQRKYQGGLAYISHFSEADLMQRAKTVGSPEGDIYVHAKARAAFLGYKLEFYYHDQSALTDSRLDGILWSRNVVGVVVGPLALPTTSLSLDWARYASAIWSYAMVEQGLNRIAHDYYSSMFLILDELQKRGYRRIGFCTHKFEDIRTNHFSISAYLYYQHLLPKRQQIIYLATPAPAWDAECLMSWYRTNRPDAVICTNHGAYKVFQENGVQIPTDLGLALAMNAPDQPEISGVRYNHDAIGVGLVDTVVSQLNNNERGIPAVQKTVLIPGVWMPGFTTRPL